MHSRVVRPLISALHDPHLPTLQFQRSARSGAWVACSRSITSSTTSPSAPSTSKSTRSPPSVSPRQIRNRRWVLRSVHTSGELVGGEVLFQLIELEEASYIRAHRDLHLARDADASLDTVVAQSAHQQHMSPF